MRTVALVGLLVLVGCKETGPAGTPGGEGPAGKDGAAGMQGAAGKDGAPGHDAAQSGSRVVAKYLVGDDGSRMFSGWYDSTLKAPCAWATASDGKTRCLPGAPLPAPMMGTIIYSDAACSTAAVLSVTGQVCGLGVGPQAGFSTVQLATAATCDAGVTTTVVDVGVVAAPPSTAYWIVGGACAGAPAGVGNTYAATIVDPASLVSATVQ